MARPRILLVPWLSELEWRIKPSLEEWADVAVFDPPRVGTAPQPDELREMVAERGIHEIDRRGWDRCVVVADEFGVANAVALAGRRPEAVEALALGHACLSHRLDGERPPINAGVYEALADIAKTDFRTFARHLTQVTQGAYDDEMTERYIDAVPMELAVSFYQSVPADGGGPIEKTLMELDVPLLFGCHEGCLMFTAEGFADAVEAFPQAQEFSATVKPSASPDFARTLRSFAG